jgi:hypothetical protein
LIAKVHKSLSSWEVIGRWCLSRFGIELFQLLGMFKSLCFLTHRGINPRWGTDSPFFKENQMYTMFQNCPRPIEVNAQVAAVIKIEELLSLTCATCLKSENGIRPNVLLGRDYNSTTRWYYTPRGWPGDLSPPKQGGPFGTKMHAGLEALSVFGVGNKEDTGLSQKQFDQIGKLSDSYKALKNSGSSYGLEDMEPFLLNRDFYDAAEVQPVAMIDAQCVEVVDEDSAQFWSVYLHLEKGGLECVGDFVTKDEAEIAAYMLEQMFGFTLPVHRES